MDSFIAQHTDFAQANITEFCDDGWSGKNFERPGVQAMLEQVKQNKIDCIIVKDLSRFGRDYLIVGNYISKIFPFMGVRFIAINDGLDSARPEDVDSLDTSFKALLYDLYSRDLSRKVRSAKRFRAQRGDFLSPFAPYGYMKCPENHNRLIVDPPAAETVRRIFMLAADGNSSMSIARMMNDEAVPTPMLYKRAAGCSRTRWPSVLDENFWTDQMVVDILRDERYVGTGIYGKRTRDIIGSTHTVHVSREDWVMVPGAHQSIVSKDEFDRAQENLRKFKHRKPGGSQYPLAGKVKCGVCGHAMPRFTYKSVFFYCETPQFLTDTDCIEVHISEKDLMAELLKSLHIQAAIAMDREKYLTEHRKQIQNRKHTILNQLAVCRETFERCNRDSKELYETFALGSITRDIYLHHKSSLSTQKEKASQEIAKLQAELDSQNEITEDLFVEKFKPYLCPEEINEEVLKELLKEVRVFPHGRLEILWNYQDTLIST